MARHLAVVLFLTAAIAFAQPRQPIPSPYAIREEVLLHSETYDAPALMRRLGLPATLHSGKKEINCLRSPCSAEVFPVSEPLRSSDGTCALKVCNTSGSTCRIVAFHGSGLHGPEAAWRVIGYQDAEDHYGVSVGVASALFTIDRLYGRGTGAADYHREWFTIARTEFRSVLNTVSSGRDMNVNPMRVWAGQLMRKDDQSNPQTATFLYFIEFMDKESGIKLFDERRIVTFSREKPDERYKFDAAHSELSLEEIETFFAMDTDIAPAQLVSLARSSLLRLARSGNAGQQKWLRDYLAAAPESPIKSELLRSLATGAAK